MEDEFSWLDGVEPGSFTGLDRRAEVMRPGESGREDGKDRVWHCDGEYIWFRRKSANPATLERHNRFVADGDYKHVETQGDVEIWQLQPKSVFKSKHRKGRQLDISQLDMYNLRRQAALAACRRDWLAFKDVMTFVRERINAKHVMNPSAAEAEYAEQYMGVMLSIEQRDGPAPGEINRELLALQQKSGDLKGRVITIGGPSVGQ